MKFFPIFILTLICFTSLVYAADMPGLPMVIQGQATINEKLAPAGTLISVKIDEEVIKEYTLTQEGDYILTISPSQGTLELYINNLFTNKTIEFESGKIEKIDLNLETKKDSWFYWLVGIIVTLILFFVFFLKRKKSKHFKKKKH